MDQQNRIKDILRKMESGDAPSDFMPAVKPKAPPVQSPTLHSEQAPAPEPVQKLSKLRLTTLALLTFIILLAVGYGSYSIYMNYRAIKSGDPKAVVEALGKLTELPQGETPSVSTITDLESVKDQPFFKDAQEDDRVVVYQGAGRAYLYRPSTNKIIIIAPLAEQ